MSTILISGYLSIKLLLVSQWVQTTVSLLIKPDSAIKKAPVSTAIILDPFLWAVLNMENNFFDFHFIILIDYLLNLWNCEHSMK